MDFSLGMFVGILIGANLGLFVFCIFYISKGKGEHHGNSKNNKNEVDCYYEKSEEIKDGLM
jgi:hypothetical protein